MSSRTIEERGEATIARLDFGEDQCSIHVLWMRACVRRKLKWLVRLGALEAERPV